MKQSGNKPQQIEILSGGLISPYGVKFSDLEFKLSEMCVLPTDDAWDRQKKEVLKIAEQTAVDLGFDYYLLRLDHTNIPVGVMFSSTEVFELDGLHSFQPQGYYPPINTSHQMVNSASAARSICIGVINYYTKKSNK